MKTSPPKSRQASTQPLRMTVWPDVVERQVAAGMCPFEHGRRGVRSLRRGLDRRLSPGSGIVLVFRHQRASHKERLTPTVSAEAGIGRWGPSWGKWDGPTPVRDKVADF